MLITFFRPEASGHLEWADPSQALNALAACNHYVIRGAGITVVICCHAIHARAQTLLGFSRTLLDLLIKAYSSKE